MCRSAVLALLVAMVAVLAVTPSPARILEDGDMCWSPDVEFPVPCDEDEE